MGSLRSTTIDFPNGNQAKAIFPARDTRPADIVSALGLAAPQPLLLLNGGASKMSSDEVGQLRPLVAEGVARATAQNHIAVIDGGTQAGIMQMMGEGRAAAKGTAPLIGVCPAALVTWRDALHNDDDRAQLDPNHTHFILTEGDDWGDETKTMFEVATTLAGDKPSLALLANGGQVARAEMLHNIRQGREVIVIAGSGRLADTLAQALMGGSTEVADNEVADNEVADMVRKGHLTLYGMRQPPARLAILIKQRLPAPLLPKKRGLVLFKWLPKARWRDKQGEEIISHDDQLKYPEFDEDFAFLERELLPHFRRLDNEALCAQNEFRREQILLIMGGALVTILGVLQLANLDVPYWGAMEAGLAAVTASVALHSADLAAQRRYFTSRLKAEALRGEYFQYLGRIGRYAHDVSREAALLDRVVEIESGPGPQ